MVLGTPLFIPWQSLRRSTPLLKRLATTVSGVGGVSDEGPFHHRDWPVHQNPTPYDILNLKQSEFDPAELRKQYYAIAKIYHPDLSTKVNHVDHKGQNLTNDHKAERFKLLTDAYNLLKDARKKAMYDKYNVGWNTTNSLVGDPFKSPGAAYTRSTPFTPDFNDHAYWNAGSWEDYENLRRNHKPMSREEKIKVLAAIIFLMIASSSLQGWFILDNVEKTLLEKQRVHDGCESDLSLAYLNYGLDDSRLSRIRRFLWFRTFGLYTDKESLDRGAREDDRLISEVIGETSL